MASTGLTPAKRRLALSQLGRERLNELTQRYALDVGDRRVLDLHVDALVSSKAVDFAELLGSLKREELQAICKALGLDRSGREKDTLVQRILGGSDVQEALVPAPPKNGRKIEPVRQASFELPSAERLSVEQPEPRVLVREQERRWGSCSPGVVRFNWRIIQAPMRLVDYVVAHELIHLLHDDHGKEFWAALGRLLPDYEVKREQLRAVGPRFIW